MTDEKVGKFDGLTPPAGLICQFQDYEDKSVDFNKSVLQGDKHDFND